LHSCLTILRDLSTETKFVHTHCAPPTTESGENRRILSQTFPLQSSTFHLNHLTYHLLGGRLNSIWFKEWTFLMGETNSVRCLHAHTAEREFGFKNGQAGARDSRFSRYAVRRGASPYRRLLQIQGCWSSSVISLA
ncbi:hypothetical protein BG003_001137, partial [Podila horticola]